MLSRNLALCTYKNSYEARYRYIRMKETKNVHICIDFLSSLKLVFHPKVDSLELHNQQHHLTERLIGILYVNE